MAQTDTKHLLVCGTNSYKPMCRTYTSLPLTPPKQQPKLPVVTKKVTRSADDEDEAPFFRMQHEFSGLGICPHDPRHNSTAIFAGRADFIISIYNISVETHRLEWDFCSREGEK